MDHFTYFMLRLRRREEPVPGTAVTGIVQQLATGEKRTFASADELVRLLLHWAWWPEPKVGTDGGGGNAVVPEKES